MIKHGWNQSDEAIAKRYGEISQSRRYDLGPVHSLIERLVEEFSVSDSQIPANAQVADIGCGTGVLMEKLCAKYPQWTIRGFEPGYPVDSEPKHFSVAASIEHGSVYGLPLANDSQDLVLLSEVVEHLNRPDEAMAELRRVLKPNGIAIITMPNGSAWLGWKLWAKLFPFKAASDRLLPAEHPRRTWQPIDTLYEYEEIQDLIQRNGMNLLSTGSGQFIPPILYGAPLFGRIYRGLNMDRFFRKLLPARFGYRYAFAARFGKQPVQ